MSNNTQIRPFHSVAIRMPEEDWRKFRALVSLNKVEVGTQVGSILSEWLKETTQRVILSNLAN